MMESSTHSFSDGCLKISKHRQAVNDGGYLTRFLVGSSVFNRASGFTTYVHVLEILIE